MPSLQKLKPSRSPTAAPTVSMEPTSEPSTETPTIAPTSDPTMKSSYKPTKKPTSAPTKRPTVKPTTISPSFKPTTEPTFRPTVEPTFEPTSLPSEEPTESPSIEPTFEPTVKPTRFPTGKPTKNPTPSPTTKPTTEPSFRPTFEPTSEPSFEPTLKPTSFPTVKPSLFPSSKPTKAPTGIPTLKPSVRKPTISQRPSFDPTVAPVTTKPSSLPTIINVSAHRPSAAPVVVGASSSSSSSGNGTVLSTTTLTAVLIAAGAIVFALLVSIIYVRWRRRSNKSTPEAIIARIRAKQAQYANSPQNRGSAHVRVDDIYRNDDQIQSTTMRGDLRDINQRMDGFARDARQYQDFNSDPFNYDPRNRLPPSANRNLSPRIPADSFRPPMNANYHQRPMPEGYNGFRSGPPQAQSPYGYYGPPPGARQTSPRNEADMPAGVRSPTVDSRPGASPADVASPGPKGNSPTKRPEPGSVQSPGPGAQFTGFDDDRYRAMPRPVIPLDKFDDHYLRFSRRRSSGIYRGEYDQFRGQQPGLYPGQYPGQYQPDPRDPRNQRDPRDLDRYEGRR